MRHLHSDHRDQNEWPKTSNHHALTPIWSVRVRSFNRKSAAGPPRRLSAPPFRRVPHVQRVHPIATDIIRQSRMQHNALRSDLEAIFATRLDHSPEQVTITAARLGWRTIRKIAHHDG